MLKTTGEHNDNKESCTLSDPEEYPQMTLKCIGVSMCTCAVFSLMCGCVGRDPVTPIFHYALSEKELEDLPDDVASLARVIQEKRLQLIPGRELDELFSRCPDHKKGRKYERLFWGLDRKRPQEGERCIWIEVDESRRIVGYGLVIIG